MVATGCTTYFDYHRVRVIDAQENGFFEDGDELILATISFRTKPGVAGSTEVVFNNSSLDKAATGLEDGDRKIISNSKGLYTFDDIEVVGLAGLLRGQVPEIIGQLVIGIENDWTPRDLVKDALEEVRDQLRDELVRIIEPMTVLDILADPAALSAEFAEAAKAVEEAGNPSFLQKLGLFIASGGNPDDILSFNLLFFVAVAPELAPVVDNAFTDLPPNMFGGAFPTQVVDGEIPPRLLELTFKDHETEYIVETYIGGGSAGYVAPPTTTQPPWDPCFPNIGTPPPPPRPQCP
jgi:hypothetical protein